MHVAALGLFAALFAHTASGQLQRCNPQAKTNGQAAYAQLQACISAAANGTTPCPGLTPSQCVCKQCRPHAGQLVSQSNGWAVCEPTAPMAVHEVMSEWPCLLRADSCHSLEACTSPGIMQGAGTQTVGRCLSAVATSCQLNPNQPMCLGPGYTVTTSTDQPTGPEVNNISVYELMCDPTSRLAERMNGPQSVHVIAADGTFILPLLPSHPAYRQPPAIWSPSDCSSPSGNATTGVDWLGHIAPCLPGLQCDIVDGHVASVQICPAGFFCPDPRAPAQACPPNHYCPIASVQPRACGPLEVCHADRRQQYGGILLAGLLLAALVATYAAMRVLEARRVRLSHDPPANVAVCGTDIALYGRDETDHPTLAAPTHPLAVSFSSLRVAVPKATPLAARLRPNLPWGQKGKIEQTLLLKDVSGMFAPGKVTAIMGPSGAGKTTLLRCLMGWLTPSGGVILVNGKPSPLSAYRHVIGFVPQDDTMIRTLTVWEVLSHSACMRLPGSWGAAARRQQVEAVARQMGLWAVRHTVVGDEYTRGISGGQRKRLSIAMELVGNPSLLFLDEPTTGLDSQSALDCVRCLQRVAASGRTVVAVLHQPRSEIFTMLDELLLLARGGSTAYLGPVDGAMPYFAKLGLRGQAGSNPADQLLDFVSGKARAETGALVTTDGLCMRWHQHTRSVQDGPGSRAYALTTALQAPASDQTQGSIKGVSYGWQVLHCAHRQLQQKYRDPKSLRLFLLVHAIAAIALGVGFVGNTMFQHWIPPLPADLAKFCPLAILPLCTSTPLLSESLFNALFFANLALGASAIAASVHTLGDELPVLAREAATGTHTTAYFMGKALAELPFIVLGAVVFGSIFTCMFQPSQPFGPLLGVLVAVEFAAWGLGYLVSVLTHIDSAGVVGVLVVFAMCVCSGLAPTLSHVHSSFSVARVLWDLSFARYSSEALFVREVAVYVDPETAFTGPTLHYVSWAGFSMGHYGLCVVALLLLGVAVRALAAAALHWRCGRRATQ